MTAAKYIVIALVVAGAGAGRAADGNGIELELCIQTARDADATCTKLTDDPAQRLECFRKARGAQLDCLEHALAEVYPGAAADHAGVAQFEPPASTGSTDASQQKSLGNSQANSQEISQENSKASQETAAGNTEQKSAASTAQAAHEAASAPVSPTTPAAESTTATVPSDPPKEPPKEASKEEVKDAHKMDAKTEETPAKPQARPLESNWVVSETKSPVDYSPLLTAVIRPTSGSPGGPVSLAIRCRGGQTALLIRTERTWHATHRNAIPVDFQINNQSTLRQNWTLSADAKIASYADDAVELLRSLPDGARLSVSVTDGAEQATFLLGGWDEIRKRVETACKWPKPADEASSGKR
jgi:Type VI secretion system VasI, EvfG, VC_A0118